MADIENMLRQLSNERRSHKDDMKSRLTNHFPSLEGKLDDVSGIELAEVLDAIAKVEKFLDDRGDNA